VGEVARDTTFKGEGQEIICRIWVPSVIYHRQNPLDSTNFVFVILFREPKGHRPPLEADYFHIPAGFTDVCCDFTTPDHTCQGQGNLSAGVVTNPSETTWASSFPINHSNHQRGSSLKHLLKPGKKGGSVTIIYTTEKWWNSNNCILFLFSSISLSLMFISTYCWYKSTVATYHTAKNRNISKSKLRGFGRRANYIYRATADCWRSSANFCG
jgi:hypothetical protein